LTVPVGIVVVPIKRLVLLVALDVLARAIPAAEVIAKVPLPAVPSSPWLAILIPYLFVKTTSAAPEAPLKYVEST
jgi:hypothetical protein